MRFPLPPQVLETLQRLEAAGFAAYAVGGCVRDDILGIEPSEYDLCSAARPEQVHALFSDAKIINTGIKHGTVTVVKDGMPLEITTFRADGVYSDARHPDTIAFSDNILDDLARRDFTCNAMAFSPVHGLKDPFDGQQACRERRLSAVGDPLKRFQEDALRILRALRFAAVLGFDIDNKTHEGMLAMKDNIRLLSRERVAVELNKLLLGQSAADVLSANADILAVALPDAAGLMTHGDGAWTAGIAALPLLPEELGMRWAALLHGLGAEGAKGVLQSLRQSNRLNDEVYTLLQHVDADVEENALPRWLSKLGYPMLKKLLGLQQALAQAHPAVDGNGAERYQQLMRAAKTVNDTHPCLHLRDLPVNGNDLLAMGYPADKRVGETLQWLFDQVLDGQVPADRDTLLTLARSRLQ